MLRQRDDRCVRPPGQSWRPVVWSAGSYNRRMPQVEANGITIEYEEKGEGEPLLLVMGLAGQLTDWTDEFIDELVERGFRVIRHDNRDAGLSTEFDWEPPSRRATIAGMIRRKPVPAGYTVDDMAADAAGLLDALGIERAHVVGMSMGGMIVQSMAINHPHKVSSLTSVMSNTGDRKNGGIDKRVLLKLARMKPATRETAAEEGTEMYSLWAGSSWDKAAHLEGARRGVERSYRPKGVERQTAAIAASPDRTPGLRKVTVPTLVIHGLEDKLVLPSGGIATTNAVPGARLLMLPDMGHDIPKTRHSEIADAILHNTKRATQPATAG